MIDLSIYKNKTVFITGNTGFKGSWLSKILLDLGSKVEGYSLAPITNPNHFDLLNLDYKTTIENICNLEVLKKTIKNSNPDIIFHLAAQPLVRYSYLHPIDTFQTNIMGTANVLEACRQIENIKGILIVTTDKCYENTNQVEGYKEEDRMGGYDPYSSSKGAAELVTSSYRNSFYNLEDYKKSHNTLVASARAGNVIGGGDWSRDRLIPDIIRGIESNKATLIRYPHATRPWQHVLEPLSGYLMLGKKLLEGQKEFAEGWNFGPEESDVLSVMDVLELSKQNWDSVNYQIEENPSNPHEANLLSLNIDKAKSKLGWNPVWSSKKSIKKTIDWYRTYYEKNELLTTQDIRDYFN